ncbi:hypothetical protein ACFWMR_04880 [Amycolatopsis thailandensis]|uniref:hypothetical protein n=1 Tax=Amycolatopsis thailandensis TaxID=589330 RepID=UPI0036555ADD
MSVTTVELTREQIIANIDRVTRARLGRSAADVVRAYRAGKLPDAGRVGDALVLADLLDPSDSLQSATAE